MRSYPFAWPDEEARGRRKNHVDTGSAGGKIKSLKRQKKSCCKKLFADIPFAAARLQTMPFGSRFFGGFTKAEVKKGKRHYEKV